MEVLDGRAVVHQWLSSRTGTPVGLDGPVQPVDDVAGVTTTEHGHDLPVVGIGDGYPGLHVVPLEGDGVVGSVVEVSLGVEVEVGVNLQTIAVGVVTPGLQVSQHLLDVGVDDLFLDPGAVVRGITVVGIQAVGDAFAGRLVGLGLGDILATDHGV